MYLCSFKCCWLGSFKLHGIDISLGWNWSRSQETFHVFNPDSLSLSHIIYITFISSCLAMFPSSLVSFKVASLSLILTSEKHTDTDPYIQSMSPPFTDPFPRMHNTSHTCNYTCILTLIRVCTHAYSERERENQRTMKIFIYNGSVAIHSISNIHMWCI